jgi:hypothetical protein
MRKSGFALAAITAFAVICPYLSAQEKPKSEAKTPHATLKIQVTITEHEGEKKLANLPYSFFVRAAGVDDHDWRWTKVRMGSRVPVVTGGDKSPAAFQYIDVGTNIDARAVAFEDGRFDLSLNLERSWVEGDVLIPGEKQPATAGATPSGEFHEPIIRQFKTELTLAMHDGQTIQSTQATDPVSGRVLTITVTMNVVK